MKNNKARVLIGRGVRIVAAILLLAIPAYSAQSAGATANSQLYLGPSSQSVTKGSSLTLTLNMSSNGNAAFAWQAYLSYPTSYFDSASVATSGGSPFTMTAGTDAASGGTIALTRFATTSHAYDGAVAIITLHSNGTAGNASVSLQHICANSSESANCSAIVDGGGNNVLGSIAGAAVTLTTPSSSGGGGSSSSSGGTTTTGTGTTKKAAKAATSSASSAATKAQGAVQNTASQTAGMQDGSSDGVGLTVLVVDQHNKPVANAQVTVDGVTVYTDKKGRAVLQGIAPSANKAVIRYKGQQKVMPLQLQPSDEQGNQTAKVAIQVKKSSVLVPVSAGISGLIITGLVAFLLIDHGASFKSLLRSKATKHPASKQKVDRDAQFSATPKPTIAAPQQSEPVARRPDAMPPKPAPSQPSSSSFSATLIDTTASQPAIDTAPPRSARPVSVAQRAALARQRAMEPGTIVHPNGLDPQSL